MIIFLIVVYCYIENKSKFKTIIAAKKYKNKKLTKIIILILLIEILGSL